MEDYLEKLCINLGIKLVYTSNKVTILSSEIKNNLPIIRAQRIFRNCSPQVAQAIISYYTDLEDTLSNAEIIQKYLKDNFKSENYKIKTPDTNFKAYTINSMSSKIEYKESDPSLEEYSINYILVSNFKGEHNTLKGDEILKPAEDDLLQLDVIVTPPDT